MKLLSSQMIHKDFVNVSTLHLERWNNFIDSQLTPRILGYMILRVSQEYALASPFLATLKEALIIKDALTVNERNKCHRWSRKNRSQQKYIWSCCFLNNDHQKSHLPWGYGKGMEKMLLFHKVQNYRSWGLLHQLVNMVNNDVQPFVSGIPKLFLRNLQCVTIWLINLL